MSKRLVPRAVDVVLKQTSLQVLFHRHLAADLLILFSSVGRVVADDAAWDWLKQRAG